MNWGMWRSLSFSLWIDNRFFQLLSSPLSRVVLLVRRPSIERQWHFQDGERETLCWRPLAAAIPLHTIPTIDRRLYVTLIRRRRFLIFYFNWFRSLFFWGQKGRCGRVVLITRDRPFAALRRQLQFDRQLTLTRTREDFFYLFIFLPPFGTEKRKRIDPSGWLGNGSWNDANSQRRSQA